MIKSFRRTLTSLLALTAFAACGASEKPTPPIKIDACALFTDADATAIAGESIAGMSSTLDEARGRDPGQCIYNSGNLEQPRILSLLIRQHRNPATAKRTLEASRSTFTTMNMTKGHVQAVPGLGDGALWVGGSLQQLHVLRGAVELVVTVQSPDGTDQLKPARQIAEKALARLNQAVKT
ncbi:MAG TPA: hypothetical protein VLV54_11340 [Thermoanaerobaculia bacterium]|nr:hypothetical protein [Thermoanaerobaculia bacterium]